MKNFSYEKFFANFASRTRFRIILCLMKKPMTVSKIAEEIGMEQTGVSHHLAVLSACNILHSRRAGKSKIYSVNSTTVAPIIELAKKHVKKYCGEKAHCMGNRQ